MQNTDRCYDYLSMRLKGSNGVDYINQITGLQQRYVSQWDQRFITYRVTTHNETRGYKRVSTLKETIWLQQGYNQRVRDIQGATTRLSHSIRLGVLTRLYLSVRLSGYKKVTFLNAAGITAGLFCTYSHERMCIYNMVTNP